jgi:hypothetical protein
MRLPSSVDEHLLGHRCGCPLLAISAAGAAVSPAMREQRIPILLGVLVTLIGGVVAGQGDWSVPAIYGIGFVAIVTYLAALIWSQGRGSHSGHRRDL